VQGVLLADVENWSPLSDSVSFYSDGFEGSAGSVGFVASDF